MTPILKAQAAGIFLKNPEIKKLWVNPKGEFFTKEDLARNSLNKDEKLQEIDRVLESDNLPVLKEISTSAKDLITQISTVTDISQLEQMLLDEQNGKKRVTVVEAIENQIEQLKETDENEKTEKEVSAKDLITQISTVTDISQLEQMLLDEKSGKERITVIEAIESQIEQLKKAEENGKS